MQGSTAVPAFCLQMAYSLYIWTVLVTNLYGHSLLLLVFKPRISLADSRRKSLFWPNYWTREPWRSRWMGPSSRSASLYVQFPCEAPQWFSCPQGSPRNLSHRKHSWLAPQPWWLPLSKPTARSLVGSLSLRIAVLLYPLRRALGLNPEKHQHVDSMQ